MYPFATRLLVASFNPARSLPPPAYLQVLKCPTYSICSLYRKLKLLIQINKFTWWPFDDQSEKDVKSVDVRMFVGPWPKIETREIYGREHGLVALQDNGWRVYIEYRRNVDIWV